MLDYYFLFQDLFVIFVVVMIIFLIVIINTFEKLTDYHDRRQLDSKPIFNHWLIAQITKIL